MFYGSISLKHFLRMFPSGLMKWLDGFHMAEIPHLLAMLFCLLFTGSLLLLKHSVPEWTDERNVVVQGWNSFASWNITLRSSNILPFLMIPTLTAGRICVELHWLWGPQDLSPSRPESNFVIFFKLITSYS